MDEQAIKLLQEILKALQPRSSSSIPQIQKTITKGGAETPYLEFSYSVPANDSIELFEVFSYFRCFSVSASGLQLVVGDSPGVTSFVGAGIGIDFIHPVGRLKIVNPTGAAITITGAVSSGRIHDDRLTATGDVAVINGSVTPLQTNDAAVLAMLQNPDSQRAALTDLTGASQATVTNTTTTLVTAGANVNGVIIRLFSGSSLGTAGQRAILILNGVQTLSIDNGGGGTGNGAWIKDIFVPAGWSVAAQSTTTSCFCLITYEVL